MSESTINAIVPAIIALIGTLLTIYVGFWQWRKQTRIQQTSPFVSEKQTAYKGLWERLEAVHVKMRVEILDPAETKKLLQETNDFILKQSLYLDAADYALANDYLKKLQQFTDLVKEGNDPKLKQDWEITGPIAPEIPQTLNLYRELEQIRTELLEKCRSVVQSVSV